MFQTWLCCEPGKGTLKETALARRFYFRSNMWLLVNLQVLSLLYYGFLFFTFFDALYHTLNEERTDAERMVKEVHNCLG